MVVAGRRAGLVDLQAGGADVALPRGTVVAELLLVTERESIDESELEEELIAALQPAPCRKLKAMALFCGVGGMCWGFRKHMHTLVAVDIWQAALDVYQRNFADTTTLQRDLSQPEVWAELAQLAVQLGIEVLHGGPPCT
jgi:hypothetical protein